MERPSGCFIAVETYCGRAGLKSKLTIYVRRLAKTLGFACVIISCVSECQAQDRRSAAAALHIQVFVMPTVIAAANSQSAASDPQKAVVTFNIPSQNQIRTIQTLRPLISNEPQSATSAQKAILETSTFIAE